MRRAGRRRRDDSRSPSPRGARRRGRPTYDSRSPGRGRARRKSSRGRGYDRSRSRSERAAAAAKPFGERKQEQAVSVPAAAAVPGDVPDWLADMFPGGAPGQPMAPAPPPITTEPIEIPLQLCGILLQDNQSAMKSIMNASGANISLRQELQHLGYSLGIITGTPDACAKAKEMLQQQMGLTGSGPITKEIEIATYNRSTEDAVKFAFEELRKRKADNVPVRIVMPEMPGAKVKVSIGPGSVAHVATVEQVIRKKLRSLELDDCYYQGKPVPPEKKVAIMCKYYRDGCCPRGVGCNYAHGEEELAVAQRHSLPPGADISLQQPRALPAPAPAVQQPQQGSAVTSGLI